MNYSSCIQHPQSSRYIQLHKWQIDFCQDNHCAALLLSHFSVWHDWKILNDHYYRRYNDIAEAHGDGRPHNQNAYLFFTMDELVDALMGLFGKRSINDALDLLVTLDVINIHKNPNPRYYFDKTKYFKFFPDVCNTWIDENRFLYKEKIDDTQVVDNFDNAKREDGIGKNARPSGKNGQPSRKNGQAITDNTNNTTNNNQSTNARAKDEIDIEKKLTGHEDIQPIITALQKQGMASKRFYPDALEDIHRLSQAGATINVFIEAYDLSFRATQGREFGVPYLVKVVEDLLAKKRAACESPRSKDPPYQSSKDRFSEKVYESDIRNALKWFKDEDTCTPQKEQK